MLTEYYSQNEMFYAVELYREFQASVVVLFFSDFNCEYSKKKKKMLVVKMIL